MTSLVIFSDFVQNDKTKYKIEQKFIKDEIESDCDGEGAFTVSGEVPKVRWLVDSRASIVTRLLKENTRLSINHSQLLKRLFWVTVN